MSMNSRTSATCLLTVLSGALSAYAPQARSQGLEEIVVTAQKRDESQQTVPISVQALSAEELQSGGLESARDLPMSVPGLQMTTVSTSNAPFLRGVGSADGGGGQESPVATYVDGVYYMASTSTDVLFNNVERVEVLKGPQGTLFGRNSTGGLIHVITKDPSSETSGKVTVTAGNYDTLGAGFYGTTGITDNIAVDLAANYMDQDKGFGENLFTGNDIGTAQTEAIRSKLKYSGESTDVTLIADYADIYNDLGYAVYVPPPAVGIDGSVFTGGKNDTNQTRDPTNEIYDKGLSLRIVHRADAFTLTSISAGRKQNHLGAFDNDYVAAPISTADLHFYAKYLTQELQIASNNSSGNTWIAGVFLMHANAGSDITVSGTSLALLPLPSSAFRFYGNIKTDSIAGFGEYRFQLTDASRLTLGGRYTKDERELTGGNQFTPLATGAPGNLLPVPKQKESWGEFTYRAVYDYQWTDELMTYASYNRGFKSGNFNAIAPATPAFDPEILDAFEIGMKSDWLDNRLRLNAAVFYYDYKDLQVTTYFGTGTRILNAAKAKIKGGELDLTAVVTDGFTLNAGLGVLDTEYVDFTNAPVFVPRVDANGVAVGGDVGPTSEDASGKGLIRTPKYTGNLGGTYRVNLASGEISATVQVAYNDGFPWEPDGRLKQGSYTLVNASLGWRATSDKWGLRLVGRNITDEKYGVHSVSGQLGDSWISGAPATVTLSADFNF